MKTIFSILIFLNFISAAFAQTTSGFVKVNNVPNAIATAVNALIRVSAPKSKLINDTITGDCNYPKTGSCNGAIITLKHKDQIVYSLTMTSTYEFKIPNLKSREQYLLSIEWNKHGLKKNVVVSSGEYVSIQLE